MHLRLVFLLSLLTWIAVSARPRSNTQRSFFPSQPQLFVSDLTGDDIDSWIQIDQQAMFVVNADFYAQGRAYTRTPDNSTIASVVSGAFLGQDQPRVACAVAPSIAGETSITCGILHTARFEFEWIVPPHSLPFSVNNASATMGDVDLIVADLDGNGKDELLTYYPSVGTLASYSLASSITGQLQFILQLASVPIMDNVPLLANLSPLNMSTQSVYVGNVFDSPSFSSSGASRSQCVGFARSHNRTVLLPPAQVPAEPDVPAASIDLTAQPKRSWNLDTRTNVGTQMPDSLILVDPTKGVVQGFSTCMQSGSVELHRILVTQSGYVPSDAQVTLAAVQGLQPSKDELLVYLSSGTSPTSRLAVYSSTYDTINGGTLHRVAFDSGDLGRAMKAYRGAPTVVLAWMRSKKPRVIQPLSSGFADSTMGDDDESRPSSQSISFPFASAETSSFFRMDPILLLPSNPSSAGPARMLQFVATFVSGSPKDRDEVVTVDVENDALTKAIQSAASSSSSPSTASSPPFGVRTYLFSFAQLTLDLDGDPDGDAIRTRHELGGLDADRDGVSDEPLHSYSASPFLRDVFVEVDYMADSEKSLMPRDGFDVPAKQDLREHGIVLHTFVDEAIPRVADLGPGGTFSWDAHIMPLKAKYFTPSRYGLFHYCLFIDAFNSGTVSGQSHSVPGSEFFVSLGGWGSGGRGSLLQQQGTFLHELGHQLNLLHGGNDDVNWKPNHLSVMNYAYQVTGVQEDGIPRIILSDIACSDLNESDLDEFTGIVCRGKPIDQGRKYSAMIDGKWHVINQQVDFNEDGKIEGDVAYDLNGDSLSVLSGSPNEFNRMRFDGLELVPGFWTHANGETPMQRSASTSRQLLEELPMQRELSFDDLTRMALERGELTGLSLLERASMWLGAIALKSTW